MVLPSLSLSLAWLKQLKSISTKLGGGAGKFRSNLCALQLSKPKIMCSKQRKKLVDSLPPSLRFRGGWGGARGVAELLPHSWVGRKLHFYANAKRAANSQWLCHDFISSSLQSGQKKKNGFVRWQSSRLDRQTWLGWSTVRQSLSHR